MVSSDKLENACIVCGKQRILVSSTSEMVGNSLVVSNEMSCPDPICQEKLNKKLDSERLKRESYQKNSQNRNSTFGARTKTPGITNPTNN